MVSRRPVSCLGSLLTCLSVLFAGCSQDSSLVASRIIELNDRGVSKMGQFQYVAAHEDFKKVTEDAPHWDVGWVNLAIATLNRQNPDDEIKTLEILQTVLERNPNNVRALYTSGIVNLYLGHTIEAIEFLNKVVAIDPSDAFGTYFLGQAHLQAGNYELAQQRLLETLELNPAIRSAYWAAATASRRLDDVERATSLIEEYQAFEHNPLSVSAGFSYKQMGPKAEAQSDGENIVVRAAIPDGELFDSPQLLDLELNAVKSISSYDLNEDGRWDVLISDGEQTVTLVGGTDGYSLHESDIPPHSASGWGDMNNDGSTELLTCGLRGVAVHGVGNSEDQTEKMIAHVSCDTLRVLDADHDGDLDVLIGGPAGLQIYHNDLNGNFIPFETNTAGVFDEPVSQLLAEDLDRDRDVDLVVIGHNASNRVLRNELTWNYAPFPGFQSFQREAIRAVTALDVDLDGRLELITASEEGFLDVWRFGGPEWSRVRLNYSVNDVLTLDAQDFDGDGQSDVFVAHKSGFSIVDPKTSTILAQVNLEGLDAALPIYGDAKSGPAVVSVSSSGTNIHTSGSGRYPFLAIAPTGKTSADQMRSNASGIGTYVKLRADTRWALTSSFSHSSGSSQSLMPIMLGSGGADQADYIELLWSDGVTQSEIALEFGKLHEIEEIQRQLASCPVVFVWNGEKYEFVSDVLGVAALGYFASPGVTTPVRSKERLLLPQSLIQPREGKFEVKIGEPMEEVLYLDSAALLYFDMPDSWDMTLDERLNIKSVKPTSDAIYFREVHVPIRAETNLELDVTDAITDLDQVAVEPGPVNPRYIGLLANEHSLTLEFKEPLPESDAVLVADGWVEFPYSQTSFAAYQSGVPYQAPTIEARDRHGVWHVVAKEFGFPGGMPRQMALPLPQLPQDTDALRFRSNLEIYWDRLRVVRAETPEVVPVNTLRLSRAVVKSTGFARRTTGPQRIPYYDYDHRLPHGDAKFATGYYTSMGDATELVERTDSAVAIVGSGEEVHLEFEVPEPPEPGHRRYYALEFHGWAKDMDLYTKTGDTIEPVPHHENISSDQLATRDDLHTRYNVRHQSGMATR